MTNLPATLSTLETQIIELTEKLAPVTEDHASKSVRSLLAAGLALPSTMQAAKAPEIYAYALSGVPGYGVRKATEKIIRGEYEINRGFIPTPPEFAAIARLESKVIRDDLVRALDKKRTLEDNAAPREKTDPKQLERIRALHIGFKEFHAASKVAPALPKEPMDAERAEYWSKIAALKDAPSISEEQQAFRRKINADLDEVRPDDAGRAVA